MGNKLTRMDLVKVVSTTISNVQAPIRAQSFLTVSARKPLFILTMVLSFFYSCLNDSNFEYFTQVLSYVEFLLTKVP